MQYPAPISTKPQPTRSVTPSPKFRKIEIDNDDLFDDSQPLGKFEKMVGKCKTSKQLGKLINKNEKVFKSDKSLCAIISKLEELKGMMTARDAATLLHIASKTRYEKQHLKAIFALLSDVALTNLHRANARDMSMMLHSLAKRCVRCRELFEKAAERGLHVMADFNPEGLSNMLLALARMNCYSFEFFDQASKTAISMMDDEDFNSQSLCYVADAFARTKHYDAELFSALAQKAIPFLDTFRPRDLLLLIDAFVSSGHDCSELLDETSKVILEKVEFFNTEGLAHLASSFAKYGCKMSPNVLNAIAEKEIPFLHTLEAKALAQLLSAFVDMGHLHEDLFRAAKVTTMHQMFAYEPSDIVSIVIAFSKVECDTNDVFKSATEAAELILDDFEPKEIAKLLGVISRKKAFSESTDHLFCTIASAILSKPFDLNRWDSKSLIDVAVAFAQGGVSNTNFMETIGKTILERSDIFPADAFTVWRLITAFTGYETPSVIMVMELVFREFMSLDKAKVEFSLVMDIVMALSFGQRNDILPYGILKQISDLALVHGTKEEVCIIFEQFAKLGFDGIESSPKRGVFS